MNKKAHLVFGLSAALFLFAACEKDMLENGGGGEKAEIFFSVNTADYNTGGDVVRNAGMLEAASTTLYLNDSIHLRATLVPDSVDELRAPVDFIDGQKLCFAAFLTNGTQVGTTAVYTYSTATHKWTPIGDPLGVTPDNSTTYRFVAYSYFDETDTPPTDGLGIDPSHDLVWGQSVNKKIEDYTEAARTVTIHMTHKFARVQVRVRSSISNATITTLSGVTVEGGKEATLTLFDGNISFGNAVTQGVSIASSGTDIYSSYRTVSPVSPAPIQVKIGTLKVSASATTFANQTVTFNSTLTAATSYTLVVDIKRFVFAKSNIYWQEVPDPSDPKHPGYLTFVPAGTDGSKEGYQGLLFRYGSLVGISPVGDFDSSLIFYRAGYSPASGIYSTWTSIPWKTGAISGLGYDTSSQTGDICQYIDAAYRFPKTDAFQWAGIGYWGTASPATPDKTDGTYDLIANGYKYISFPMMGAISFPSSGYRVSTGLRLAGEEGRYWMDFTGSDYPYLMYSHMTTINAYGSSPDPAFPIRCVCD
jgi:hypothetical protein